MKFGWILMGILALLYIITGNESFGWMVLIVIAVLAIITFVSPPKARFKSDIEFEEEMRLKNQEHFKNQLNDTDLEDD